MSDAFANIIERDLAEKCTSDVCDAIRRNFQLCDTQRGAVVVAVAGMAGAATQLAGAFYATYEDELSEEIVDTLWRTLMRGIVVAAALQVGGPLAGLRADIAGKPAQ